MAREINFDSKLSKDDLLYVQQRPWLITDAELLGQDVIEVREQIQKLAFGEDPFENAVELTVAAPLPVEGEFNTQDEDSADPDNPEEHPAHEETDDNYEQLKVAELRNEIEIRNSLIADHNEALREQGNEDYVPAIEVPATAHKADLILILRESDSNEAQQAVFDAADDESEDDSEG